MIALVACGTPAPVQPRPDDPCRPAYATYEQLWRTALLEDLDEVRDAIDPSEIDAIVESQVVQLPNKTELETLRSVFGIVELFVFDASWPKAFDAADRAIAVCGESAKRP